MVPVAGGTPGRDRDPYRRDDHDISGWDFRKTLQLLLRSNPPLHEWLVSPIVYREDGTTMAALRALAERGYAGKSMGWHYLRMADRTYKAHFRDPAAANLKKYFYVIRPLCALIWLVERGTLPPMNLGALLDGIALPSQVRRAIDRLLQQKTRSSELGKGRRLRLLDRWIERQLGRGEKRCNDLPAKTAILAEAEDYFRRVVGYFTDNGRGGCRKRGARMKLTDFTTLTFDMMGTLMDYEAGFVAWFRKHAAAGRADVADNQILEALARAEEVLQRDKPHPPFTRMLPLMYLTCGQRVLAAAGQGAGGIIRRLGGGVAALSGLGRGPALPAPALPAGGRHQRRPCRLQRMSRALGDPFHDAVTAEDVGVTKPDLQVFAYMLGRLSAGGTGKRQILHTAQSQYHDIGPARSLGLATAWIERRRGQQGAGATPVARMHTTPDFHFAASPR